MVLFMYSANDRETYDTLKEWVDFFQEATMAGHPDGVVVETNAQEPDNVVLPHEGPELAKSLGLPFARANALTDLNVDVPFSMLAFMAHDRAK
ncbi:small GTPase superfamily protein [Kipferlia bialata]|uniref:Small GTPase superfamily protein n=1 Tax=Kipferlia bialata TaxID=797122 RepID=A0A9K3GNT0_9EUKA|nr:small GTPase superfamily protein [Kipferlia bialata]|eukprot:g11488.t1